MPATVMSSHELQVVIKRARELARKNSREITTLYVLIGAAEKNTCSVNPVLRNLGVKVNGEKGILETARKLLEKDGTDILEEPSDTLRLLQGKACTMASQNGNNVDTLFFFVTMIRMRKAIGSRVLEAMGAKASQLRQALLTRIASLAPLNGYQKEEKGLKANVPVEPGVESKPTAIGPDKSAKTQPPTRTGSSAGNDARVSTPVAPEAKEGVVSNLESDSSSEYELDPDEFPQLVQWTNNVTARAARGETDPIIGRDKELNQVINILKKRQCNNPCLVGEPGVGKTALVEGLARELVNSSERSSRLHGRIILELETAQLVAGTQLRGSFSERMISIREEVERIADRVIIFIDEIHTLIRAGGGESALDAANELKTALARGKFPTIGATTVEEFKLHFEKDKAFNRRFEQVMLTEPNLDEATSIIRGNIHIYEKHHGVSYEHRAVEAGVRFSARFMPQLRLPAKAIAILDQAGASVSGVHDIVTEEDVARTVAEQVGIPVDRLLLNSPDRFLQMGEYLRNGVVGHSANLEEICSAVKRGFAGFSSLRPLASFLFAGPPGVGKGQAARTLARFLFDRDDAILMFQGTEFTEKHSIAKLIGSGPGYVGHERGGRLTEGMNNQPFRLILFKDLLSASPDIQDLVAEMLNSGVLTDGQGRRVHFSNSVVVLTQDLDEDRYFGTNGSSRVGFAPAGEADLVTSGDEVLKRLVREFPANLLHSVDERLVFFPQNHDEILQVIRMEVTAISRRLEEERNISFNISKSTADYLIRQGGYSRNQGVRMLRQTLNRTIISFLADKIHCGEIQPGQHVEVDCPDGQLTYDIA